MYDAATPAGKALADAAVEFEDFLRTPLAQSAAGDPTSSSRRYIERLADLTANIARVADAMKAAETLRGSIADAPMPPIITFTTVGKPTPFSDLYVGRTLVEKGSGKKITSREIGIDGGPYRAVVHGTPGAGKSTFVQNLRRELAARQDGQPAFVLTARKYLPAFSHQTIAEYLIEGVRTSLNLSIGNQALHDMLTLGQAVVIFDGLDEITDIALRVEMVTRITSFATEFPTTSVLVTSRAIGYERAPLPADMFRTLVLDEYSADQAHEYIERWFSFAEREDLVDAFEHESGTVADLKSNPLMLSLLCILYRERGSIPRRRRDIYAQCADLLFHTWDSHRHIDQPEELHANGDRIMQEIARWVYNSSAAQNGLPQSIIEKTIGGFLRDNVGVESGEARRRSAEFLEFCATRAWLLGAVGSAHGERLFGFTHRTFFEYFTAEAESRTSGGDPVKTARVIVDAHTRDATSVLPELLLQAIDDRVDLGAPKTFNAVCDLTSDASLIIRLMDGVPLPAKAREHGFDRVMQIWEHGVDYGSLESFLSLNMDARDQFIREFLTPGAGHRADAFLAAWATLDFRGGADKYSSVWADAVLSFAADFEPADDASYQDSIRVWRWWRLNALMPGSTRSIFVSTGIAGLCPGTLWLAIERQNLSGARGAGLEDYFSEVVARVRSPRFELAFDAAVAFGRVGHDGSGWKCGTYDHSPEGDVLHALMLAVAITFEARDYRIADESFFDGLPSEVRLLCERRIAAAGRDGMKAAAHTEQTKSLPRWLKEWSDGRRDFVSEPSAAGFDLPTRTPAVYSRRV